jgi:hypothetical protein
MFIFNKESAVSGNKSWLASCAVDTMKRFADGTRRLNMSKDQRELACYGFSLLIDSTDLTALETFYELLCIIFLSPTIDNEVNVALLKIRAIVRDRPSDEHRIQQVLTQCDNDSADFSNSDDACIADSSTDEQDDNREAIRAATIKAASPYTTHFNQIHERILVKLNAEESFIADNYLNHGAFIAYLNNHWMPYAFIWSSCVMKNMNKARITNGIVEKYFDWRKNKGK